MKTKIIALWDAINSYVVACGGSPAPRVYGHRARQVAKAEVEKRLDEIMDSATKKISEAARELLAVTGELDEKGGFHVCPQSSLTSASREAIEPWIEDQWRALHALVGEKT